VLDPGGIAVCTAANGQWEPAVAFDGTNYLVVWHDYRSGSYPDVYGTRVTGAGVVLDPAGIAISAEADNQWYPAVVFDGSDFLVTWEDRRSGSTYDIYGARVSGAGVVLDPAGIPVSTAAYDQRAPAAAFDGTNVIVAWIDARSASYTDIYGARVAESGVVLDTSGFAICTAANDQWYPAAAFDGADFLVVWTDGRGGTYAEIDGARVTPGGVVADTFPVARHEGNRWSGALAVAPGGQTFLACGGWVSTAAGKTYNTYRVLGKLGPFPGVEESPRPQAASSSPAATIVRGVLFLPQSPVANRQSPSALLDISGREVLALRPGANDVRHLAPGVYFVRTANGEERITNKVVITG
jgi:hypothetical protein